MTLRLLIFSFLFMHGTSDSASNCSETVSWTIGDAASKVDGVTHGPVTFTWTFDRPVQYGVYLDGTPWVIWEEGLKLIAVSPAKTKENLLNLGAVITNGITDATCINPASGELPLDERMGYESGVTPGKARPWGGGMNVWDETATPLTPGDCIVTGLGRRLDRGLKSSSDENDGSFRRMLYTAIGVCNVVGSDMTGRYRPPIRMPRDLRAALVTPREVAVDSLPSFNIPQPKNWTGGAVSLSLVNAIGFGDADDLLNGPMGNCGIYTYVWYEPPTAC